LAVALLQTWPLAALATAVMGMGFYMLHNTLQTNATQMAPERRGTAVGQFAMSLFVGQSVGVGIAGAIAQAFDTDVVLPAGAAGVFVVAIAFAHLRRRRAPVVAISS